MIPSAAELENNLPTKIVGKSIIVYDEVDSTNDVLKKVISGKEYNGLAIFARHQRRGRGQNSNRWIDTPDASILCSIILHLSGKQKDLSPEVSRKSATAVLAAITKIFDIGLRIKWPNDIYYQDKKLAGILIESSQIDEETTAFVIGVGINCSQRSCDFPPELRATACSISQILQKKISKQHILNLARQILIELDDISS